MTQSIALGPLSQLQEAASQSRRRNHHADLLRVGVACETCLRRMQLFDRAFQRSRCDFPRTLGVEEALIAQPVLELRISDIKSFKKLDVSVMIRRMRMRSHVDAGRIQGDPIGSSLQTGRVLPHGSA